MENKHAIRSQATRAVLVTAARRLFGDRGYAAVGTEEIVRAAGVTRGALYHQFRDKAELFEAVVVEVEEQITRTVVDGALTTASDPAGALRAGARAFLECCLDPEVERILLTDAPGVLGWQRWRAIGQQYGLGVVTAALQAAMDAGAMPEQPVRPLAHLVMGALDEAAMLVASAEDRDAELEAVLAALDGMLLGRE